MVALHEALHPSRSEAFRQLRTILPFVDVGRPRTPPRTGAADGAGAVERRPRTDPRPASPARPSRSLVIVGCGGFGREVFCTVRAVNAAGGAWEVEGFVDDDPSPTDRVAVSALGGRIVGTVESLAARTDPVHAVVAIGGAATRRAVVERLAHAPVTFPVLVHPDATIGHPVSLGVGVVVAAGARLSTNVVVGTHVHVDQNATVGHDAVLHDFSRLNPQACVSGSVVVGAGALVGASATVLQGLRIGESATVGAGAVVTRSTPPDVVATGVPARTRARGTAPAPRAHGSSHGPDITTTGS